MQNQFFALPFLCLSVCLGTTALSAQQPDPQLPHLEKRGAATQLIVDGKPFLMLSGELHNSSSSSLEYMKPIWPQLAAMGLNTVVTPLSWELIEPEEGKFDFTLVDGLLDQARREHQRIVFLWLATWKNGMSSYAPVWVKRDTKRFPRVIADGKRDRTPDSTGQRNHGSRCARLHGADAPPEGSRQPRPYGGDDAGGERGRRAGRYTRPLARPPTRPSPARCRQN